MNDNDICAAIRNEIGGMFACEEYGEYHRIRTPYLYPDGDAIELFCKSEDGAFIVTDLAETTGWLRMQSQSERRSPKQTRFIMDASETLNVEFRRGMLQARCKPEDSLADVVARVAQAALRVSDLWFTVRNRGGAESILGDVAEYLTHRNFEYERSKKMDGRSTRVWNVDFHVRTPARGSLVYVLTTGNRAAARGITNRAVATWHDLSHMSAESAGREGLQFVSLFDDDSDVWDDADFRLAEGLSTVALWSKPDEFADILSRAD